MELSLLPCPFCGKPAEASHTMRATIEETMEAEPYINCSQPKCAGRHVCASVSEWQYRTDRIAELELFTRAAGTSLANANDRIAELEQQLAAAQERERRLHDLLVEAAVEFRRIGWEVTAECLTDKADEITCAKE